MNMRASGISDEDGPEYAGKFEGILQNFADLFKLLFKEMLIPNEVDKAVFVSIPLALMFIAGSLLALVPLGPDDLHRRPLHRGDLRLRDNQLHARSSSCSPDGRATTSTRCSGR